MSNNGIVELYRVILTDSSLTWENADLSDALPKKQIERLAEHTVNNLLGDQAVSNLRDLKTFINNIQADDYDLSDFFEDRLSTHDVKQTEQWTALSRDLYNNQTNLNDEYIATSNTVYDNHQDLLSEEVYISNKLKTFNTNETDNINTMSNDLFYGIKDEKNTDASLSRTYDIILNNIDNAVVELETNLDGYKESYDNNSTALTNDIDIEDERLTSYLGDAGTFQGLLDEDETIHTSDTSTFDYHLDVRQTMFAKDYKNVSTEAFRVNKYADNGDTLMNDTLTTYSDKFHNLYNSFDAELENVSDVTYNTMSDLSIIQEETDSTLSTGLNKLSNELDNLDNDYKSQVNQISTSIYDTQQDLIDYENRKVQEENPVFTGTLVLNNSTNANTKADLNIGDKWKIRSVKTNVSGTNVVNLELAYSSDSSFDGTEKVIKFASQEAYAANTTADDAAYKYMTVSSGTAQVAEYYYVYPNGNVDAHPNRKVTISAINGSTITVSWGDVVPRGCKLSLVSDNSDIITVKPVQDA